ncbi:MAG: cell division protein FtsZ [Clostridia bacterium]|nr:cell division protein FtsZ [Clostridia bacterium]
MPNTSGVANIKVIGIGGGGNNAINRMICVGIKSATFIAANTDMQALNMSPAPIKIQLGASITKGLGAGSDPDIGKRAAEESREEIRQHIEDADLLFITAGMGGGTGTGAAPVIASMAKELGILTIAVVTKPFERFEGKKRMENAISGIEKLKESVDTLLVIPNEKISMFVPKGTPFVKAFQIADEVLRQGIQGISDIITTPSLINLDFADIRTIMKQRGNAHIGIGRGKGDNRTLDAVRQAVQSPLLETNIAGASGVIVYVTGDQNLTIDEVNEAVGLIREVVDSNANIIFGMGFDDKLNDEVQITVIATGFNSKNEKNKYNPMANRPIFGEQNTDQISKMYGYMPAEEVAAAEKPVEKPAPPREPVPKDGIQSPRMDVGAGRTLPPFLLKLQEKNRK